MSFLSSCAPGSNRSISPGDYTRPTATGCPPFMGIAFFLPLPLGEREKEEPPPRGAEEKQRSKPRFHRLERVVFTDRVGDKPWPSSVRLRAWRLSDGYSLKPSKRWCCRAACCGSFASTAGS